MKKFETVAANENHKNWENIISRECELYSRLNDTRNIFERDYNRIIHSTAYCFNY